MYVTNPSNPTGPLACIFPVLIPTSVPNPYRNPSANRELAFTNTPALSTPRQNALADSWSSVTITSVWCDPCALMCAMAAGREGSARTESVRERCSVVKEAGVAGVVCVARLAGGEGREVRAARVGGSHWRWTLAARRARATVGQRVGRRDSWTRRVSRALQAAG